MPDVQWFETQAAAEAKGVTLYGHKAGGKGSAMSSLDYKVPVRAHSCKMAKLSRLSLWPGTAKHLWQWRITQRPFGALEAACSTATL